MQTSTSPAEHTEPVRHIDWTRLDDERAVLAQVWAALPAAQEQRDKAHLLSFLEHEGLVAESIQQGKALLCVRRRSTRAKLPSRVRVVP